MTERTNKSRGEAVLYVFSLGQGYRALPLKHVAL